MFIFQDWQFNKHDLRIRIVLVLFRLSQFLWQRGPIIKIMSVPYFIFYRVLIVWIFHIELLPSLNIGRRLRLFHGYALVIHPSSVIGDDVTLRHCTTLGNRNTGGNGPQIGDRVNIGSNSVIIGDIRIGNDVTIGAGSVVIKDVPSGESVAGNPARILHPNKNIGIN
jgi:putative colanic acid biosynthesis acetyltransferase WcaB